VDGSPADTAQDPLAAELGTDDPEALAARDQAWTKGLLAVRAGAVGTRWVRLLRWVVLGVVVVILAVMARNIATHGLAYFLQTVVYGLGGGSLYALIALGYTMVYGIIELINFAHADVVTFGGFISLTLVTAFGFQEGVVNGPLVLIALVLITAATMLICGVLNITIERVAYRPLRKAPKLAPSCATRQANQLTTGANTLNCAVLTTPARVCPSSRHLLAISQFVSIISRTI